MVIFQHPYTAQGDLNIFACDSIPGGITPAKPEESGNHILAHSETGHHHVVSSKEVELFNQDEFISFLDVKEETNIIHLRSFDTHETIGLPPGKYRLTRQREYVAEGYRRAAD